LEEKILCRFHDHIYFAASYMCAQSTGKLVEIIAWRFLFRVLVVALYCQRHRQFLFDAFERKTGPFASGLSGMGLVLAQHSDLLLRIYYRTHELADDIHDQYNQSVSLQRFLQLHLLIRNRVREKIKIKS